jgi:hypothetical protein
MSLTNFCLLNSLWIRHGGKPKSIRSELDFVLSIFRRGRFAVIKVSNKPIESVANEIIEILSLHYHEKSRKKGEGN